MTDELTRSSAPAGRSGEFQRLFARLGGDGYWIAAEAAFLSGWTIVWACRLGIMPPPAIALGLGLVALSLIIMPFIPTLMARHPCTAPAPGEEALPERKQA